MVKSFKINLLDWLKTKIYVKDEIDTKLANKANTNHTHDVATQNANGFLSKEDKVKLDGIAEGANKTIVDSSLSSTSVNAVQSKMINSALNEKANVQHNHAFATVVNRQSTLNSKSDVGHIHDDRYYTETEMDTKLDNKANSTHTHNDTYYTKDEINARLGDIETFLNEILGV